MSWLTRGGKAKEEAEGSGGREERGLLVQAMLEHGGDPWDHEAVGREPTLKAAERHWVKYVATYHPKGDKKCSALQWLLFDLASVLQAAVEEKEQRIASLQSSLQVAHSEILALRCHSALRGRRGRGPGRRARGLGGLLSPGRGPEPRKALSERDGDVEVWDGAIRELEKQETALVQGKGAAGTGKTKPGEGDGGPGAGEVNVSKKEKVWKKEQEGWPVWVHRIWHLEQHALFTREAAKRVVTAIGLPWPKVGAVLSALPPGEASGGEILRLVVRNLGEYEPLKDNMEGAPWRDVREASAYLGGNVVLRVLKQREKPLSSDFDILGVSVEQGDIGVLACRAPELHRGLFISLGSTLIGRPLRECLATLENLGALVGAGGKEKAKKEAVGVKMRTYIPRGIIWRYLINQGVSEGELDSQPTGVLLAKMKKILQEKGMKQEEIWEKLKQMKTSPPTPKRK